MPGKNEKQTQIRRVITIANSRRDLAPSANAGKRKKRGDEDDYPRGFKRILHLQKLSQSGPVKKKKKTEHSDMKYQEGESISQFSKRLQRITYGKLADIEITHKKQTDTNTAPASKKNSKKNAKRSAKRAKKAAKEEKEETVEEALLRKSKVQFGDVVTAPPILTAKPKAVFKNSNSLSLERQRVISLYRQRKALSHSAAVSKK